MDPCAILETLTKAGFVPVWLGNNLVTLMEASPEQWTEIRGSKQQKTFNMPVARKVARLLEMVKDLDLELENVEDFGEPARRATKKGKAAMKGFPA